MGLLKRIWEWEKPPSLAEELKKATEEYFRERQERFKKGDKLCPHRNRGNDFCIKDDCQIARTVCKVIN